MTTGKLDHQLRALREIGLVLESTMSLDEILTIAAEKTTSLMGAESSSLYLVQDDGNLVSRVIDGDEITEIQLSAGQGISGWVTRHCAPLLVLDAYKDERFDPRWDEISGFKTRCIICQPIRKRNGEMLGVVEVLNKCDSKVFEEADLSLLGLLADQLSMTIENSQLMVDLVEKNQSLLGIKQDLVRRNHELDLLLELEQQVASADSIDLLAGAIIERTIAITQAEVGILYRPDATGAEVRVIDNSFNNRVIRVQAGAGLAGWVAVKKRELNLPTPKADPRFAEQMETRIGKPLENMAAVPLILSPDQPAMGALMVANKQRGEQFDEADMNLLRLISSRLARAMDRLVSLDQRDRNHRLATVGRLLAGVLHDLKSPVSVISGYSELLAEKAAGPEADEYLGHINRSLSRITTMAEDIISFSRGERRILLGNIKVKTFMECFIKQITGLLTASNVKLDLHVRTSGIGRFDEDKILRVFHNIVRNAVEAMAGGGTITIEVDHIDDSLVFSFSDTGTGIPEEIQGVIFQSFVTLGKQRGTGLGLAVSKEIVEAHNGQISFSTVRHKGTTFMVKIPV